MWFVKAARAPCIGDAHGPVQHLEHKRHRALKAVASFCRFLAPVSGASRKPEIAANLGHDEEKQEALQASDSIRERRVVVHDERVAPHHGRDEKTPLRYPDGGPRHSFLVAGWTIVTEC